MLIRRRRGSIGSQILAEVLALRQEVSEQGAIQKEQLAEAKKTNGRVTELEEFRDNHDHTVALDNAVRVTRKLVRAEERARLVGAWDFLTGPFLIVAPSALILCYAVAHFVFGLVR